MSKLYLEDYYTSPEYDYIIAKSIIEYDMKDAGFNLIKYYNLLPEDKIQKLEVLPKAQRKIAIGNLMREDKKFNIEQTESFGKMRKIFFEENELEDSDVLSIKKDAIFVVGKRLKKCKFKNVEFVEKHIYTSYHKFGKLELYYSSSRDSLDVKGINDSLLDRHEPFMGILKRFFCLLEKNDKDGFVKLMKRFSDDYKKRNLSYGYYREFNSTSAFTLLNDSDRGYVLGVDGMDSSLDSKLDISYNYINFIIPLISRFHFNGFSVKMLN